MASFSDVDVGGRSRGSSGSGNALRVSVSDPVKVNEGMNAFITYKVNTQTDRPEYQYGSVSVIRRYREFEWLHAKLVASFPGCIIPPLPEKSLVGRFETNFVEGRRRALERFLHRVAAHPVLASSRTLVTFLQADDTALAAARGDDKRAMAPQPKKMMEAMTTGWSRVQHTFNHTNVELPKNPLDGQFEEITTYVNALETHFQNVQKETTALIKKEKDLSDGLFQWGLSLTLLGQNEVSGLSDSLRCLGHTADTLSVASASEAEQEMLNLEEPIGEYTRMIGAVKDALKKRQEAKMAYHHALVDVENRKATRDKMTAQHKADKAAAADAQAHRAQEAAEDAKREFNQISETFVRDFERYKREKGEEMQQVLVEFVKMQVTYHKKVQEAWSNVLPKLETRSAEEHTTPSATRAKQSPFHEDREVVDSVLGV